MSFHRGLSHRLQRSPKSRRASGVSRRQRKKQLGFETLEDRRVMSANSPLFMGPQETTSYSSADAEGAQQILIRELQKYFQQASAAQSQIVATALPTDPLTENQWHLINVGQQVGNPDFQAIFAIPGEDLNLAPIYNNTNLTGAGVVVAVIDSAFQVSHPDLAGNVSTTLGLNTFDTSTGPGSVGVGNHGTSVAGIIGAIANNGIGGSGIASGVTLVPIEFLTDAGGNGDIISAFRYKTDQIDITNNSWGPGVIRGLAGPTANETLALRDSIFFGRPDDNGNALGVIHVFAAGNSGLNVDTAGYNGWVNSRYTIGVTGVDHDGEYNNIDGTVTSYPETSASVLVAAPTGSNTLGIVGDTFPGAIGSGIYTTDVVGEFDYNISPDPDTGEETDRDYLTDTDYTSRFNGTSAAAPMVTGVISLMLEQNPNLSWRDVQEILLRSARQNSEFATLANGVDKAIGIEYQNTWITNQVPLFHDPDFYDPLIPNDLQILHPTLDPLVGGGGSGIHYAPTPQTLTNGAGYTVSQGRGTNRENTGFAHGVVDAELAVQLAGQWHTKNQKLANELTFTTALNGSPNLPAAETLDDLLGARDLIIPGGLFGDAGFSDYWAEYLEDVPDFSQGFTSRGRPIELTVPSDNDMTIETIELTVDIDGNMSEFLDNVRIVLVSPNGTHSELNHYFVDPGIGNGADNFHQTAPIAGGIHHINGLDAVSAGIDAFNANSVDTGISTFTFSTNRNWGERSDDAIMFDPTTAEPAGEFPGNLFNSVDPSAGNLLTQGWQLYMENYSTQSFTLDDFEIAWHGSPIDTGTERVQGLIGVDDNRDDLFNFSRVTQAIAQLDANPELRFGEVQNLIDETHESMAANITVFAHRDVNANGVLDASDILVDQFVTGADGNYYFDLVPDNYIFSLDDASLGSLSALDDSLTGAGFLQDYQAEWSVGTDFFQVWDYDTNLDVPVDANGAPLAFLDSTGEATAYGMKHINFLLDPGAPAAPQVDFSGSVFADYNGDGVLNGDDVALPGVGVFGDVNRNGQLDSGEVLVKTDALGQYTLTVTGITAETVINVGVRSPANWSPSSPVGGFKAFFVEPGLAVSDTDFYITPPAATTAGDGSALSGIILGSVFNDKNEDTLRQGDEGGVPSVTVYIDMNNSGAVDAGDVLTQTNSNGGYAFANVADGSYFIRIDTGVDSPLSQTTPILNLPHVATVVSGGTVLGNDFGVSNGSNGGAGGFLDYGDLPDVYGTRFVDDGARHPEGLFFLGTSIDSEADGKPTSDALGDDNDFLADEDGVTLVGGTLVRNSTGTLTVTASRHSGFLQAWFDFNNNGSFGDIVDGVSEHVVINKLLDAGANTVSFDIPLGLVGTEIYARFRFGEYGLGSTGAALIGEVEDYQFNVTPPVIAPGNGSGADFNNDGVINGHDFLSWQRGFGATSGASPSDGDSNDDGKVDAVDLNAWSNEYGETTNSSASAATAPPQTGDFNLDGKANGSDFLAWQRGFGTVEIADLDQGDGTQDGNVDAEDLSLWSEAYGALDMDGDNGSSSNVAASSLSRSIPIPTSPVAVPVSTSEVSHSEQSDADSTRSESIRLNSFIASARGTTQLSRFQFASDVVARYENDVTEDSQRNETELLELRIAQRDEALGHLFAKRSKSWGHLLNGSDSEELSEDALEFAMSEETNWRIG